MNRSRRALLAALCILALALGAATLNDTTAVGGGGSPSEQTDSPVHDSPIDLSNSNETYGNDLPLSNARLICIDFLTSSTFYALTFVGFLLLGAVLYRKGGILLSIAGIGVLVAPGFIIWALLTRCGPIEMPDTSTGATNESGSGGLFGESTSGVLPTAGSSEMSQTILVLAAIIVIFLVLFMLRATDDDSTAEEPTDEPDELPLESLAGLAGVAGEAADRIESAGAETENEVYRAWQEMTEFLDVPNPQTSTPAEFRAAAETAGLADRHVDALTELFRDVRYGGAAVTADREEAAVDALREIERIYGTEGNDGP